AGVLSFVPYVGSLTALVLSLGVAVVQGWPHWGLFLSALAVVGSGQFLEGNVLSPKLVGESVGLHPVWVMFALVAFGALFGFTGLLIAVPVAAAMGVVARHMLVVYRPGPLYGGNAGADGAETPCPVSPANWRLICRTSRACPGRISWSLPPTGKPLR